MKKFYLLVLLCALACPANAQFGRGRKQIENGNESPQTVETLASAQKRIPSNSAESVASRRYVENPLGIGLETWEYPWPVQFMDLDVAGEKARMAYMDSSPFPNSIAFGGQPRLLKPIAVLLLHGKNFSGFYWQETIQALDQKDYRVIVPDQIGFGKSSKPDIEYSFDLWADNTAKLLDKRGITKFLWWAIQWAQCWPSNSRSNIPNE